MSTQCQKTETEFPWKHNEKGGFGPTYPSQGILKKLKKAANY